MKHVFLFLFVFVLSISVSANLIATPKSVRWTEKDDDNPDFLHVLEVMKKKTGVALSPTDFMPLESRTLATSHFVMFVQVAEGVPIKGQSLRIWTSRQTAKTIQVEARIDNPPQLDDAQRSWVGNTLSSSATVKMVRGVVRNYLDDPHYVSLSWQDYWEDGELVRVVKAKGRTGYHKITISLSKKSVVSHAHEEFPQVETSETSETSELGEPGDSLAIPVRVYPVYEEAEATGKILERVTGELKGLKTIVARPTANPFTPLLTQRYIESKWDPILGLTVEGRKQGFWSMGYVKLQAADIIRELPLSANSFSSGGVMLEGEHVTVNLHPLVPQYFKKLNFTPAMSAQFRPDWHPMPDKPDEYEMVPSSTLRGRLLKSYEEAWERPCRRLADHDANEYINDGFDEIQVYWAVEQLFQSLRPMGFTDPELSTRAFHAFLYDPDVSYRDNAYYTDDTINFTTYSSRQSNMARDNTTIWHELGHGVMDRVMGDHIQLADTGGLSEGMADFIASLVTNEVTQGKTFEGKEHLRIYNRTGFYLTNEVHDDGEAYGGAMQDLLDSAIRTFGRRGLVKVTDLTLEAMRLARNHPALTANDWFSRMLFADERGKDALRRPGELKSMILGALSGRNFNLDASTVASFTLKNGINEVTSSGPGSRPNPIKIKLLEGESKSYAMAVGLKSSADYGFKYPVTVKVRLRGGPLQGAIHWTDEADEPTKVVLQTEADTAQFELQAHGKCDEVNRPDGSCVDYAYIEIWNNGETKKPCAKKRFYLRVYDK